MFNKKGTFLIYFDNFKRDYLSCCLIQKILEKKNYSVFITSRKNLALSIDFINFDYLISINNVFSPFDEKLIKKINNKIILIDAEGAMTEKRIEWLLSKDSNFEQRKKRMKLLFDKSEKIFLWNNYVSDKLKKANMCAQNEKFIVTGSLKLSIMNMLAKKSKKTLKSNTIGIVSRFISTNDFGNRTTLENILVKFNNKNIDDQYYYSDGEVQGIYIFLEIIDKIILNTNYNISIKPHPNENYKTWKILEKKYSGRFFVCDPKIDFIDWIIDKDQIICTPSTSMVESIAAQKKIVSINKLFNTSMDRVYFEKSIIELIANAHQPNSTDEVIDCILGKNSFLDDTNLNLNKTMLKYYNFDLKKDYKVADQILNLINYDDIRKKPIVHLINNIFFFGKNFYDYIIISTKAFFKKDYVSNLNDYNFFINKKSSLIDKVID